MKAIPIKKLTKKQIYNAERCWKRNIKSKALVYPVLFDNRLDKWVVQCGVTSQETFNTKEEAVAHAREQFPRDWELLGLFECLVYVRKRNNPLRLI